MAIRLDILGQKFLQLIFDSLGLNLLILYLKKGQFYFFIFFFEILRTLPHLFF